MRPEGRKIVERARSFPRNAIICTRESLRDGMMLGMEALDPRDTLAGGSIVKAVLERIVYGGKPHHTGSTLN